MNKTILVNDYTELDGIGIETAMVRADGDVMVGGFSATGAWLGRLAL